MNSNAILDLLEFGFALKNELGTQLLPPLAPSHISDRSDAEECLYRTLVEVLSSYTSQDVGEFALSGGADTRLIMAILAKANMPLLQSLRIYTRIHPQLNEDNDRDVAIAKKLCALYGVDLKVEHTLTYDCAFLRPLTPVTGKILSGLFGGELLGGHLLQILPFSQNDLINCTRYSQFKELYFSVVDQFNHSHSNELQIAGRLALSSLMSAIYSAPTWLYPLQALQVSVTPFLDERFLRALFSIDSRLLSNYGLYKQILINRCPEALEIPINNIMAHSPPRIQMPDWGAEPKSTPNRMGEIATPILTSKQMKILEFVNSLPEKRNSDFLRKAVHLIH